MASAPYIGQTSLETLSLSLLYLLDRPSDRRFWRPWTQQEIEESERDAAARNDRFAFSRKKSGEGCFLPDAYLPQHRRHRFMGELPHQWLEIYGTCDCGELVEYWIKFCDGIATECRSESPTLGPGFFDDAVEPRLDGYCTIFPAESVSFRVLDVTPAEAVQSALRR